MKKIVLCLILGLLLCLAVACEDTQTPAPQTPSVPSDVTVTEKPDDETKEGEVDFSELESADPDQNPTKPSDTDGKTQGPDQTVSDPAAPSVPTGDNTPTGEDTPTGNDLPTDDNPADPSTPTNPNLKPTTPTTDSDGYYAEVVRP